MFSRFAFLLIVPMISSAVTQSAPVISGVVNAASNRAPGLPASGIAQGAYFTVYGSNLGPTSYCVASSVPYSTAPLCEVSLTVTVGSTSTYPIPTFVYAAQINAILPSVTPTGDGTITVTYGNQTSATYPIQVVTAAFGAFTPSSTGSGQASVTDNSDGSLNTIIHTLHPGDIAVLWGTGLGAISGSDAEPPTKATNIGTPTVYVGNTAVTPSSGLLYAGRSPQYPGLDQIDFYVPQGVQGCYVPIGVKAGDAVGNIGTIAVAPAGQDTCTDSIMGQDLVNKLAAGNNVNFGYIRLESAIVTVAGIATSGSGSLGDYASATFSSFTPQTAWYAEYGVSAGYCASTQYYYGYNTISDLSLYDALLDAGNGLTLQGRGTPPGPIAQLDPPFGFYYLFLSTNTAHYFISDSTYTVSGPGGANVNSFTATDTTSTPSASFTLSSVPNNMMIDRTKDFAVQWTYSNNNLPNAPVTIGGLSESTDGSLLGSFQCTAPAGSTTFTIPAWVLSTLPQSGAYQQGSFSYNLGFVWVGQYNTPSTFQATGLDRGIITDAFFTGTVVNFQ